MDRLKQEVLLLLFFEGSHFATPFEDPVPLPGAQKLVAAPSYLRRVLGRFSFRKNIEQYEIVIRNIAAVGVL